MDLRHHQLSPARVPKARVTKVRVAAGRVGLVLLLLALAGCAGDPAEPARSGTPGQSVAPADLAAVGATVLEPEDFSELGLDLEPMPAEAELVSSHYAVSLAGVAVTEQLTGEQLEALLLDTLLEAPEGAPVRAGEGREFLVVPLATPESASVLLGGDSAEVIVEGESRPLDRVPHEHEVLVVNVPAGGDATLAITDAGETKTISLRTGERDSAAEQDHPADALLGGRVEFNEGILVGPEQEANGLQVSVSLEPRGHLEDRGWAEDGHMWLLIEFDLSYIDVTAQGALLSLDVPGSLSIRGSDGTTVELPDDDAVEAAVPPDGPPGLAIIEWSGVAEVPDTLRSFEVTYATDGTFRTPDGATVSFTRYTETATGTIELTER